MLIDWKPIAAADAEADAHIREKWHSLAPSHFLRYALDKHGLDKLAVADVGSSYGHWLRFFGPGSYGVEMNPEAAAWANANGLKTYCGDMEEMDTPPVDATWNSDVFEHVNSPHIFLRSIARILKDGGLNFTVVPLMSPLRHLAPNQQHLKGWRAADHVNFFTPATLRATFEFAGFEIVEMTMGKGKLFDQLAMWAAPACVVVARKIPGWEYGPKSTRQTVSGRSGRKDKPLRKIGY